MRKKKINLFDDEVYNDLEDNVSVVVPILTECDVNEDFTGGVDEVGDELPVLPLRNMVLFPGVAMPVIVGRPKSMRLIKEANQSKSLIAVVCQKDMDIEEPGLDDLYSVGVIAEIVRILELPDGSTTVILQGKKRFELESIVRTEPYMIGKIQKLDDEMPKKNDREIGRASGRERGPSPV